MGAKTITDSELRESFTGGPFHVLKFSFSSAEMKLEAQMNKKIVFIIFGTIIGITGIVSGFLAIFFSEWGLLVISVIPLCILPFGLLEINEKITIDSQGISVKGSVFPRPCDMSWSEIEEVRLAGSIGIVFMKKGGGAALVPNVPEALYAIRYYYPEIDKQAEFR